MKKITSALVFTLVCLSSAFAQETPASTTLVRDGMALSVLVAAADLSPSEITALAELQKHIEKMSGVKLEILTPEKAGGNPDIFHIVVGNKTVRGMFPQVSLEGLGTDGYIVKTIGNNLLIAGGEKRGTMYAAFEVLERLGCRWWAVGATHVPQQRTITLPGLDLHEVPVLEYRDMLYGDRPYINEEENGAVLYSRNKVNGFNYKQNPDAWGGRIHFAGNLVHTHHDLMREVNGMDGSFEAHPEYWALVNGRRNKGQVCPLNPRVFEIMMANVLAQLKAHPEYEFVVVGQEDNNSYCRCEDCAALAEQEGTAGAAGFVLANKIAEVVEREHPGKWVMTPAYTWSRKPPKTIRPRANVGITLCSIECDFNRPLSEQSTPKNKAFAEDIMAWSEIAPKLYIWDYATNFSHYLMPFPNLDVLAENMRFFASHGVRGILMQGSSSTAGAEFSKLRMWVLSKLLWNPERDGKALIAEFLEGYYGAAAPALQEYIDLIHGPGRANPGMSMTIYAKLDSEWLTPGIIAESEAIFRRAEAAVADDTERLARVQLAHLPVQYILLKRGPLSNTWAATVAKVGPLRVDELAERQAKVVDENNIGHVEEGEPMKAFRDWALDYGERCRVSVPLPAEVQALDPSGFRYIEAAQFDERSRWWLRDADAVDGWATQVPTVAWKTTLAFSRFDDVQVGKTYALFLRVKTTAPTTEEFAFICGIYNNETKKPILSYKAPAALLQDTAYHVLEVGRFEAAEKNGHFWMALPGANSPTVYLDSLWLVEVK